MSQIHGIIACAGSGTRFAASVGKPPPYPKHLEKVGEETVLTKAFKGLIRNIPVNKVTFTVNPRLQALYVDHIKELQEKHPDIELSYSPTADPESIGLFPNLKSALTREIRDLSGISLHVENPVVAIALGDSVVTEGDKSTIAKDLETHLPSILDGQSFAIYRDIEKRGLVYWLSRLHNLDNGLPTHKRAAMDYGIRWWNCNSREELAAANKDLGYPLKDELSIMKSGSRKEVF